MKNLKTIAIALVVALGTVTAATAQKKIDVKKSTIAWVGKKVTGQHEGTVNFQSGSLTFTGKKVTGGTFTIDMTSIAATDLKADQGKDKLEGHLKSPDFFGTEKYPTSTLVFKTVTAKSASVYTVVADLTIKGITKPVTFDLAVSGSTASTAFSIDRTKYDIKYNSKSFFESLGDKVISDDFDVKVVLVF